MQAPAGPSGPPVDGPSGPPSVAGPTGAPQEGPSGPPTDVNPAQFDPLAEIEDARARRKNREERLETLQKKRNSARVNVYLFLAITVVLAGFAFFPVTSGDTDLNPFPQGQNPTNHKAWVAEDNHLTGGYEDKIWDGNKGTTRTADKQIYIPPPLPDMGSTSSIRIDVTVDIYRLQGNTSFKAGMFDGECTQLPAFESLDADSWYHYQGSKSAGESVEFTLYTQPGQKCFLFMWDDDENPDIPPLQDYYLPTVDIELAIYWPRMITVPIAIITFLFAGFAFIGAQKSGKAFKALKYPEGEPEKKIEEEVLEAAESEQREQIDAPVVDQPENADAHEVEGPSLAEAASSPEQGEVVVAEEPDIDESPSDEQPADEPTNEENSAASWTDEQLLGAGWTQEQIDAMRNA